MRAPSSISLVSSDCLSISGTSLPQSDDLTASRPHVSREEQELRDVEMEMESQLNTQHMQVRDGSHLVKEEDGESFCLWLINVLIVVSHCLRFLARTFTRSKILQSEICLGPERPGKAQDNIHSFSAVVLAGPP